MSEPAGLLSLQVRADHPSFQDLPWHLPVGTWAKHGLARRVELPRGSSRHDVEFVSYGANVYVFKELPPEVAVRELQQLMRLEERRLPAVAPVGQAQVRTNTGERTGVLITQYLQGSLPYRNLFQQPGLERYRDRLLDAVAGLLVRLHLAGFYWGDCSLSNTLLRRDAGELKAYLVDAETSGFNDTLADSHRRQDLLVLQENVAGELAEVAANGALPPGMSPAETGIQIRHRYERLWTEVTREVTFQGDETYRIHERVSALNALGFTVGEIEVVPSGESNRVRMRALVTDRDWHRDQLHSLTGVVAEERQAQQMLNEIREMRAWLSAEQERSLSMSEAAFHWQKERYDPTVERLAARIEAGGHAPELYCQVLEHKWFLSERAKRDVGLDHALDGYLQQFPTPQQG